MRFIKPSWLTHGGEKKEFEVYSCHVSSDGARLATAGGDGHVRIWSIDAILNSEDTADAKPRQLASLSHHSGTIHTVRFASNNRYLASGADDKIVCVYALEPTPPVNSTFGSGEAPPSEHWRVFRRLIGHDNDVQDLGWSHDSSILVSVGLDSKVVVWSGYTFEKLRTLSNHQSHVKGIAFDPANKYFVTASDDRTMKVFRFTSPNPNSSAHDQINNFLIETTISAPFATSPLTTYFRRCSWSPDAGYIAAANAVNGPVSSVVIIDRGSWDFNINLIGHEGPVEVCAFSPRLYDIRCLDPSQPPRTDAEPGRFLYVTMLACGGQDKALSVWTTGQARPLLVAYDLTLKSISDLCWGPDGTSLYITSLDGSIVAVTFDQADLGQVIDIEENERSLRRYGTSRKGAGLADGAAGVLLEEESKAGEINRVEGRMGELMGGAVEGDEATPERRANGENVVTKISVSVPQASAPASTTDGQPVQSNGQGSTEQRPEKEDNPRQDSEASKLEKLKQRVTITKDGKKRIAPLLVSGSSNMPQTSLPRPQLVAAAAQRPGTKEVAKTRLDLSSPYDKLPRGGLAALLLGNKRKLAALEGYEEGHTEKRIANASREGAVPILTNGVDGLSPANASSDIRPDPKPEFIRPAVVNPILSVSQVRLAVPKIRSRVLCALDSNGKAGANNSGHAVNQSSQAGEDVLEVRNPAPHVPGQLMERNPARIAVTNRGQPIWQDFLLKSVLLVTGTQKFWAAACEEGSLYVWTPAGRRMLNSIIVEAQPVILESSGWWLLCITAVGMCYVWNLKSLTSPHSPVSLAPILNIATHALRNNPPHMQNGPAVTSARLNSEGKMIISLSNGDGYTYSPTMLAWQRLSEAWWAVGSQYWNSNDSSVPNVQVSGSQSGDDRLESENGPVDTSAGIIPHLERRTTKEILIRQRGYQLQKLARSLFSREGFEGLESSISIAHLENRIAAAILLGAKKDFRDNLYMYAKRIGAEGQRHKVEEVLRALIGGVFSDASETDDNSVESPRAGGSGWQSQAEQLCGSDRRELLRGVILILGKYRDLQRITLPYANLLGMTNEHSDHHDPMEA